MRMVGDPPWCLLEQSGPSSRPTLLAFKVARRSRSLRNGTATSRTVDGIITAILKCRMSKDEARAKFRRMPNRIGQRAELFVDFFPRRRNPPYSRAKASLLRFSLRRSERVYRNNIDQKRELDATVFARRRARTRSHQSSAQNFHPRIRM